MLLALALLLFAIHVAAWMFLPAGAARSEHAAVVHVPEFGVLSTGAASEA